MTTTRRLFLVALLMGSCWLAQAQRADGIYHISCMVQKGQCTTHPNQNAEIGIGGRVGLEVTSTHELMDEEGAPEVTDLVLYLEGQALPGTHPIVERQTDEPLPPGAGEAEENNQQPDSVVTFRLIFPVTRDLSSDKGKESWKRLLGGLGKERKEIPISVGMINGPPLPSIYKVEFIRLGGGRLAIFIIVVVILSVGFLLIAAFTGALRDKEPSATDPSGREMIATKERAYSLSRMQVAVWTLLVVCAYLFIWIITGEYNTEVPGTILAILGISTGTYVTAAAIDKEKATTQRLSVAKTESLTTDLFSGASGASIHRVQFGLWSVVLMIVFVITVYETLAMPQFDKSLLGLMGISSAAYAGMKIPERKQ